MTNFTYNPLNQMWTTTGPMDTDYTHSPVRPTDSLRTVGFVVWHDSLTGSSSNPKPNVRPDTVMASAWDALNNLTRTAEDRFGLPLKLIDPLGQVTTITRDTLGQVLRSAAPNGHVVLNYYYGWAAFGPYLMNATCDSTNVGYTCHEFNYAHHRLVTDSGGPQRLDYSYHNGTDGGPAGTLDSVYVGDHSWEQGGAVQAAHYRDAFGRDTLVINYAQDSTRFIYAAISAGGNLDSTFDAKHHRTKFRHNAYGQDSVTTYANGTADSTLYDVLGRVKTAIDPEGHRTRYTYGALGLTHVVDPNGETYKFDLNAWGLTKAVHDLADTTKADSMWYDAGGRLRMMRSRVGDTLNLTYDALGRVLSRETRALPRLLGQEATFAYGPNGAWTADSNANGRDSVFFDAGGRTTRSVQRLPNGTWYTLTYTYDWYGRLIGRSAPTGGSPLAFYYDPWLNMLDSVHALGAREQIGYNLQLLPDSLRYNGAWYHWQVYDSLAMVVQDTFSVSQLSQDLAARWTYDSLGRLTRVDPPSGSSVQPKKFGYDSAGRLVYECNVNQQQYCSQVLNYSYDAAGNETDLGSSILPGNRLSGLTYDADGRVTYVAGDTLMWDALGQLIVVLRGTPQHAFTDSLFYDANGRRVGKWVSDSGRVTRTYYVYDGSRVIMDVDSASGWKAEYAWNSDGTLFGIRTPSWTGVAISSPTNGTLLGLADPTTGAVIHFYDPLGDPWNQEALDSVVRFGMGGQEYDRELGFYHLGARYYDPNLHRFLTEDPAGTAGGLNLYVYAGNDPINDNDPSGMDVNAANVAPHGVPDNQQPWYLSGLDDIGGGGWMDETDYEQAVQDASTADGIFEEIINGACRAEDVSTVFEALCAGGAVVYGEMSGADDIGEVGALAYEIVNRAESDQNFVREFTNGDDLPTNIREQALDDDVRGFAAIDGVRFAYAAGFLFLSDSYRRYLDMKGLNMAVQGMTYAYFHPDDGPDFTFNYSYAASLKRDKYWYRWVLNCRTVQPVKYGGNLFCY